MRQDAFVARHEAEWRDFETWLVRRGEVSARLRRARPTDGLRDDEVPARYRRLCQQLALARRRGYSPQLGERLQALMQRGHDVLYRAPPPPWRRALRFLVAGFPRLVRAQRGCLWLATALLALPTLALFFAVQQWPELVHSVFTPQDLARLEAMYDPADPSHKLGRESGTDMAMFGHYIMNNISIGFRTFAAGLLAGVGTALVLVSNGVMFGVVAGHLQAIGHGDPFWRFVAGHSAPELVAIVIAGAAGLRLGLALLAPGRLRRVDALAEAGRVGAQLCLGILVMLLFAAFVEAFWSSTGSIPAPLKFGVGALLWILVLGWLALGGRGRGDDGLARHRRAVMPSDRPGIAGPDDPEPTRSRHGWQRQSDRRQDFAG
ncbi:MAG TPA: stage II sporulation protein M [Luteimonas sp.]|nr:stage II sporulation protein M [Luteimonas sp.]HRP72807.1 stage II sporulation protein M [Luteimonas sp.]